MLSVYQDKELNPQAFSDSLDFLGADLGLVLVAEPDSETIFKLSDAIATFNSNYTYCVIDTLPSFGHLHLAALTAADYVFIPVKPAPYPLAGMKDLFGTIEKVRRRLNPNLKILGIVINQAGRRQETSNETRSD